MSGSESSTRIRTFPDWSESSGHRIRMTCDAHDGGDSPRKTTTGPKSGLKIKICLKSKFLPPQVHMESGSAQHGSGLIRWHKSGERILVWPLDPTRTALPLIGTGTQQTLGPDPISCLWPNVGKENGQNWKEKDRPHQKNTSKPKKKKSGLLFYLLLLLLLLYTFLFLMI